MGTFSSVLKETKSLYGPDLGKTQGRGKLTPLIRLQCVSSCCAIM